MGNHFKIAHALLYVGGIIWVLYRSSSSWKLFLQNTTARSSWVRNLILGILLLTGVSVAIYVIRIGDVQQVIGLDPQRTLDNLTLLCVAVFVYAVGYLRLRHPCLG